MTDKIPGKKCGDVLNILKPISTNISDLKLMPDDQVKVKLFYSDCEKLKEEIGKLDTLQIKEIEESKTEKPANKFGGYYRKRGGSHNTYRKGQ